MGFLLYGASNRASKLLNNNYKMFLYNNSQFKNHAEALNRVKEEQGKIKKLLHQLTFDYINKIGNKTYSDFLPLRDSIKLRLNSIIFHYDLLASINISGKEIIADNQVSLSTIMQIALKQSFLFDSIIFNALSLFDYSSCLVKFIIEKNKQQKKLLWTSLAKIKMARGNENFKKSSLAILIDKIDRGWVNYLGDYRAELIHYSHDTPIDSLTYNLKEGKNIINIHAPFSFQKHFKELKKEKELNINNATLWIINNSITSIHLILEELIRYVDINRLIPPGIEVITFKPKTQKGE